MFPVLQVSLKDLCLSSHARQKMIALSGQRYDPITDEIKLIGEKCPTRKQNREYVMYLLKVLYLESNVSMMRGFPLCGCVQGLL